MPIPDFQSLMLPVLKKAEAGEVRIGDVIDQLADEFALTPDERSELIPSGKQPVFYNRVHWAKSFLGQAGLVEATRRAHFKITDRGRKVLAGNPTLIDNRFLSQFPEFVEFRQRHNPQPATTTAVADAAVEVDDRTPDDVMRAAHSQINAALGQDLLDRIAKARPEFFEKLIVQLLLAMGYGGSSEDAGRAIGRSGDDGVDGVIDQDPLGLDRVYIQAKRYQPDNKIGAGAIRDFFGSLDMHKAAKGLFVTTSGFSHSARETADKLGKRLVLIGGNELAQLMIRHNVGCKVEETLAIRRVDEDFFE